MGDAIILGTSAKLYVENNVYNISGGYSDNKIIKVNSTLSNKQKCISEGYLEIECGTYYYAANNNVNGSIKNLNAIVEEQNSSGVVTFLDPNNKNSFWLPSFFYTYQMDNVDKVKELVLRSAGVGKLIEK